MSDLFLKGEETGVWRLCLELYGWVCLELLSLSFFWEFFFFCLVYTLNSESDSGVYAIKHIYKFNQYLHVIAVFNSKRKKKKNSQKNNKGSSSKHTHP